MRAFLVGAAATLALASLAARPVRAEVAPETDIGAGQVLVGTATGAAALSLPVFTDGTPLQPVAFVLLAAGPAAIGGMVCTLGQTSRRYTGRCGPVIGAAYLGALAALPLTFVGGWVKGDSFRDDEGNQHFTSGPAIGSAVGYAVGAAIGATIAWHRNKETRDVLSRLGAPPAPASAQSLPWLDLDARPAPGGRARAGKTVPLLAFTF